ncbi:50S ribosomal protein L6 [Candidatus Woesearchaeota archaeon]|jgi:large subunit ribosomal protein L6|nr:50S ribosomal protein L6 [Candidatus Woesearchaeota archaeon]MBT6023290.1 50S ribosomal protein L6 [Candidatus Woesearchaeota archaeon]
MATTRRTRVQGTHFRHQGKFRPVLKYRKGGKTIPMPFGEKVKPEARVTISEGVTVIIDNKMITFSKGEYKLSREYPVALIKFKQENNEILIQGQSTSAKVRAIVGSFNAHLKNIQRGLEEPFIYKLKITSVHFPMTAKIENNIFELKNFLGGKKLRTAKIPEGVDIKLNGDVIELSSRDIELVGMASTRLELLTRVTKRDRRVFQDGIFITEKAGKVL